MLSKKRPLKKIKALVLIVLLSGVLSGSVITTGTKKAEAYCTPCILCLPLDAPITVFLLNFLEDQFWQPLIEENIEDHINSEINWIVDEFFEDFFLIGLAELSEYLAIYSMYQMQMVGTFFDAKNQVETTTLYAKLHAEAHKDYHPSDDFCYFGTNIRSLAASESRADVNLLMLSNRAIQRQIGYASSTSANSAAEDKKARWKKFVNTYCDPRDNYWTAAGSGLDFACDHDGTGGAVATGATDRRRVNADIDYTATIDEPRTLNFDFTDNNAPDALPAGEEDVLAMQANLYGHNVPLRRLSVGELGDSDSAKKQYLMLRSVAAKRNVAVHSFNKIVSLKSSGTNGDPAAGASDPTPDVGSYMAAVIRELMPPTTTASQEQQLAQEIYRLIGENPSYYAQMEILTKKIYQTPQFFANLYDKPANVARKKVAMKALELMLDRELLESELRQEMLLSVMLSGELEPRFKQINKKLVVDE